MTTRNLDRLFKPQSPVRQWLQWSSDAGEPETSLDSGCVGFRRCRQPPLVPDLAIIAVLPDAVPGIIHQLGERGIKAAVVITAGLNRERSNRISITQKILNAAKPHLLRVVGLNCLGVLEPGIGLNASIAHINPLPGKFAFITQSGAIVTSMIDWATNRDISLFRLVALGHIEGFDQEIFVLALAFFINGQGRVDGVIGGRVISMASSRVC